MAQGRGVKELFSFIFRKNSFYLQIYRADNSEVKKPEASPQVGEGLAKFSYIFYSEVRFGTHRRSARAWVRETKFQLFKLTLGRSR
jgi:hypothetical protein